MIRVEVEDRGYETPCHVWKGSTNDGGYGMRRDGRTVRGAHLVAYERAVGPVPEGLLLDHRCRVRCCVNPAHLEPVTQAENVRRGSRTRLTADDVAAIRAGRVAGETNLSLAARFGVHPSWISRIVTGRSANRFGPLEAWAL